MGCWRMSCRGNVLRSTTNILIYTCCLLGHLALLVLDLSFLGIILLHESRRRLMSVLQVNMLLQDRYPFLGPRKGPWRAIYFIDSSLQHTLM